VKYTELKGSDRVQRGDEYNPWGQGWRKLPPSYGWRVSEAPASKFRRPILSSEIKRQLKELL